MSATKYSQTLEILLYGIIAFINYMGVYNPRGRGVFACLYINVKVYYGNNRTIRATCVELLAGD
jgi:hypothetical protein